MRLVCQLFEAGSSPTRRPAAGCRSAKCGLHDTLLICGHAVVNGRGELVVRLQSIGIAVVLQPLCERLAIGGVSTLDSVLDHVEAIHDACRKIDRRHRGDGGTDRLYLICEGRILRRRVRPGGARAVAAGRPLLDPLVAGRLDDHGDRSGGVSEDVRLVLDFLHGLGGIGDIGRDGGGEIDSIRTGAFKLSGLRAKIQRTDGEGDRRGDGDAGFTGRCLERVVVCGAGRVGGLQDGDLLDIGFLHARDRRWHLGRTVGLDRERRRVLCAVTTIRTSGQRKLEHAGLLDKRQGRPRLSRIERADDGVDLVLVEQLPGRCGRARAGPLVVADDDLHLAPVNGVGAWEL
jgi:hypothetical protein